MVRRIHIALLGAALTLAALALLAPSAFGAGYVYSTRFGGTGTGLGQLSTARGVAVDGHGDVFVTEGSNNRVSKFTTDGSFVTAVGSLGSGLGQFTSPSAALIDHNGQLLVGEYNARMQVLTVGLTGLSTWGSSGSGTNQFAGINQIATDSAGNIYVTEYSNGRVQKFDAAHNYVTQWALAGASGIAIDGSDTIYVSSWTGGTISVFNTAGVLQRAFGTSGGASGQLNTPSGLALAPDGTLIVNEWGGGRISQWDPGAGTFLRYIATGGTSPGQFQDPWGAAVDKNGDLFVTDQVSNYVSKFVWDDTPPAMSKEYDDKWWNTGPSIHFLLSDSESGLGSFDCSWVSVPNPPGSITVVAGANPSTHANDGINQFWVRCTDKTGNTTPTDYTEMKIDTRPPVSSASGVPSGWATEPITVTVGATDVGAGVASLWYQIDGGGFNKVPDGGIPFSTEGDYQLQYYAVDLAGNIEATHTAEVKLDFGPPYAFDTTPPTVTTDADSEWHAHDVTVNVIATDDVSGIDSSEYRVDPADPADIGSGWTTGTSVVVPAAADHSNDGVHLVQYRATDLSDNTSAMGKAYVKIDTRKPVTTAVGASDNFATNAMTFSFGLAATDVGSGVGQTFYAIDGGAIKTFDEAILLDTEGAHTVDYWSIDSCVGLQNLESHKQIHVTLDWNGPMAKPLNTVTVKRGKSATFKFSFTDNLAAKVTAKLLLRNKADTKTIKSINLGSVATSGATMTKKLKITLAAGKYKWTVTATDPAGNVGSYAGKALTVKP